MIARGEFVTLEELSEHISAMDTAADSRAVNDALLSVERAKQRLEPHLRQAARAAGAMNGETETNVVELEAEDEAREGELLHTDHRTLLAMLDRGELTAADLTPAVQLKLQREMNQESMMLNLFSTVMRAEHDTAMQLIDRLRA